MQKSHYKSMDLGTNEAENTFICHPCYMNL